MALQIIDLEMRRDHRCLRRFCPLADVVTISGSLLARGAAPARRELLQLAWCHIGYR